MKDYRLIRRDFAKIAGRAGRNAYRFTDENSAHTAVAGQRRHRLAAIKQKSIARRLVSKGERMPQTVTAPRPNRHYA